ncbi:MAG: hypothetical protein ACRENU_17235 [Gemmatimonadaceae bacterium]
MTRRQVAWFLAAYVALVAAAVWFDLAVLCAGDAKYDAGCGGFSTYIPLWEMFLLPLPIAAIVLERWRKTQAPPAARLILYLAGIIAVSQIGFLLIEKFPVLLITEAAAIALAVVFRGRSTSATAGATAA